MDDLILYFLSGIFGNQVAEYIIKKQPRDKSSLYCALRYIFYVDLYCGFVVSQSDLLGQWCGDCMEGDRYFQYVGQFLYSLLSLFD